MLNLLAKTWTNFAIGVIIAFVFFVAFNATAKASDFFMVTQYCQDLEKVSKVARAKYLGDVYEYGRLIQGPGCTDTDYYNRPPRPANEKRVTFIDIGMGTSIAEVTEIEFLDDRTRPYFMWRLVTVDSYDAIGREIIEAEIAVNAKIISETRGATFFGFEHGILVGR